MIDISDFDSNSSRYLSELNNCFSPEILSLIKLLALDLFEVWKSKKNVYLIGNGGSAANAIHIANDFIYLNNKLKKKKSIKVESLSSNTAIITCLANDKSYDDIFSFQLTTKADSNDLLIILSGSGNSKNIIRASEESKKISMKSFGIIGFDGGAVKEKLDDCIHLKINDMQVIEDMQTIIFHNLIQELMNI